MKLLLFAVLFLVGCKEVDLKGDEFCKIYPSDGYADCAIVMNQDPIKVTDPVEKSISDMTGYISVPEKQFAKYRRAYEKENEKIIQPLALVQSKLNQKRLNDR